MKLAGHVACITEIINTQIILVGKPEGTRPFGRPRHRRNDNIKMGIKRNIM
jgi:hypothetical protein